MWEINPVRVPPGPSEASNPSERKTVAQIKSESGHGRPFPVAVSGHGINGLPGMDADTWPYPRTPIPAPANTGPPFPEDAEA